MGMELNSKLIFNEFWYKFKIQNQNSHFLLKLIQYYECKLSKNRFKLEWNKNF